jgi:hypothetical protein
LELDMTGVTLNVYVVGSGTISSLAVDPQGFIWVGNSSNGSIYQVDPLTGTVVNTIANLPATVGVSFDSFGRMWATARNATPLPSEVRRIDAFSGALEVATIIGLGTLGSVSTRFNYAFVVDPQGDADGDGEFNVIEIFNGTSPYDAQSRLNHTLLLTGPTSLGSTFTISVIAPPTTITNLALALSVLPSPGLSVPGVFGSLWLNPATIVLVGSSPFVLSVAGSISLPVAVPMDPGFAGVFVAAQGLTQDLSGLSFTNTVCILGY